jgi:predicted esterase
MAAVAGVPGAARVAHADGAAAGSADAAHMLLDPHEASRSRDLLGASPGAAATNDTPRLATGASDPDDGDGVAAAPGPAPPGARGGAWCAPELGVLAHDVCFAPGAGTKGDRRTLVIFLHGVIQPDSGWQWTQQRGMAMAARRLGFTVLLPRGRRGIGPPGMTDWWTWPTAARAQGIEPELFAEWQAARAELEQRDGKPFDEVFVFGFSNGAYYTTSLAARGRAPVDGYAAFAGGAGAKHIQNALRTTRDRKPFFLGIASKDKTTVKGARTLAKALAATGWPHRAESLPVGHAVADRHLEHALDFLRAPTATAVAKHDAPTRTAPKKKTTAKKATSKPRR